MTALFVRNNDDPANRAVGESALREAIKAAASVDLKVNDVERYDVNIVSGIINVAKERDANDIVIGLHRRSNIVDTFYGSLIEGLLGSTNKMVVMARCFIPVNTVRSLMVIVPPKAEYETGFREWVGRIGNLASQLGCRVNFLADNATIPYIQGVISTEKYNIRHHYEIFRSWDDFLIFSNLVLEDDLMIVVGARRTSISYSSELAQLPSFLGKYFKRQNLVVIYPEQFGDAVDMPTPIDPLSQASSTAPSSLLLRRLRISFHRRFRMTQHQKSRTSVPGPS